jgi:cobalt/nickel transport protein
MRAYKNYIIFLGILLVLSPLGIILPKYFKAGNAWGEWSAATVKEQTGHLPEGMKKDASMYSAPMPDYNPSKKEGSLTHQSAGYMLSGAIGIGIIVLLTLSTTRIMKLKKTK